jgi:small subunit ribosomal protein S16
LGSYDPRQENKIEQFNVVKIKEHMSKGAKLSDTVHNFLVSKKVIDGKKKNVLPKKSPIKKDAPEGEAKAPAAAPAPTV